MLSLSLVQTGLELRPHAGILFSLLSIDSVDLSLRLPQEFVTVGHIACGSDSNSSYYHFSDLKW